LHAKSPVSLLFPPGTGPSRTAIALVAAVGWVGYLIGPPLIGQLAQWAGLSAALITVPVMMTLVAIAIRFTNAFAAADTFTALSCGERP
jgi:predicted MFS family arabinose efflux permease